MRNSGNRQEVPFSRSGLAPKLIFFFAITLVIWPVAVFAGSKSDQNVDTRLADASAAELADAAVLTELAANFPELARKTASLIVNTSINKEIKGDFFIERDDFGDLFFKVEDLVTLKLRFPPDRVVLINGEKYAPLSSVRDISYAFDEKALTVSILGKTLESRKTSIELYPLGAKPQNLYYPRETSLFFNYGLNYSYADPVGSEAFTFSNKIGARTGDFFFVSDSLYTKTDTTRQFVRLQSSATYERRNDLQWLVLGDQFANSGDLGSAVNMGGIGFSKVYRIDPYLLTQPLFDFRGVAQFPSEADIYLDGVLVKKQSIAPGQFDISNIYSYTGSHNLNVVLKDPFGNEQTISYPFYLNTQLLREGLYEYSYNVGFLREQYGIESNEYGKPAFSAFHRYGVTNSFNIGARAEGSDGVYNAGVSTAFTFPHAGAFILSAAGSTSHGTRGSAASFQYAFQYGSLSTNVLLRGYSRDYATVGTPPSSGMTRSSENLSTGFQLGSVGGFSLGYSSSETYDAITTRILSANYSRQLSRTIGLFATASTTHSVNTVNSVYIGLNFSPANNIHASTSFSSTGDTSTETVQMQKDVPIGEGVGYRLSANRNENGSLTSYGVNPSVQYNAPYGIYTLDSTVQSNTPGHTSETYNASASGSIVYTGGFFGASRPVNDSFSIVMADGLSGATVLNNGQDMGTTNSSGTMVVPNLASYGQNQITLDLKNTPMDYAISGVNQTISPSLWSGSCVAFDTVRVRALTGTLFMMDKGKKTPLEYVDIKVKAGNREVTFPTGKSGEFYIENQLPQEAKAEGIDKLSCRAIAERRKSGGVGIQPGTYEASVDYQGSTCRFSVTFPKTEDPITDIGEVQCVLKGAPTAAIEKAAPAPNAPEAPKPAPVPEPKSAPKASVKDSAGSFELKIGFNRRGDPTSKQGRQTLAYIARLLQKDPGLSVVIEGHGDRHGVEKAADRLALMRADRARDYLLKSGVKPDQIGEVVSLGRKQMICAEETAVCDRLNRRIVIKLVQKNAEDSQAEDRKDQAESASAQ